MIGKPHTTSVWSDKENPLLMECKQKGMSASEISRVLKNKSRCAVLGRLKRIGDGGTVFT